MVENSKSSTHSNLLYKIKKREAIIGIIGLGYVGLPLVIHFGQQGFKVIGFDVDERKVDMLFKGKSYIKHIQMEHINEKIKDGKLDVTVDFNRLREADCILICVPTPLTDKMEPDLSYVLDTTKYISENLRKGQIIILESTTYPGTTEEIIMPRLETKDMSVGQDYFLAYSPEREDPGNKEYNAANIPKVVGGVTPACLEIASALYNSITSAVPVSSTRAAEMTKILENTFRSVNIALVNELKVLGHKMDIDIFEVINAAATKPFGYKPFYPGPGLGGHCIPIDPFYLSWKAKEYDFATRFIQLAGEVNVSMPYYVIERTIDALNLNKKSLNGSRILMLGVAYKKDIDDDRESPGYTIMKLLLEKGALVSYNDPWVPMLKSSRKYNFQMKSTPITPEVLREMDAVIIVADHSAYDFAEIVKHSNLIIDTRNATSGIDGAGKKIFYA
ncbi:MAG: nucleotide sugar dehydrogenase [Thermodesulfobacteriota bacterium]